MLRSHFNTLARQGQITQVKFIESSCSPLVIELHFRNGREVHKGLLKDEDGSVVSCRNIAQAYTICRDAGIHKATLLQVIPHDEACAGNYSESDRIGIPLSF